MNRVCRGILAALLTAALLSGCLPVPRATPPPSPTPTPTPAASPRPGLTYEGEDPYALPLLTGFPLAEETNARLAAYFSPVAEMLRGANGTRPLGSLVYELVQGEGGQGYRLLSRIADGQGNVLVLPDISLSPQGRETLPPWPRRMPLDDRDFLRGAMLLGGLGVELDFQLFGRPAGAAQWYALLVEAYEGFAGQAVGLEGASPPSPAYTHLDMQAIALDFAPKDAFPLSEGSAEGYQWEWAEVSARALRRIEKDVFGRYAQDVTLWDVAEQMRLFLSMYDIALFAPEGEETLQSAGDVQQGASGAGQRPSVGVRGAWQTLVEETDYYGLLQEALPGHEGPVTRLDMARGLVAAYEAMLPGVNPSDQEMEVRDSQEPVVQRVLASGMMGYMPPASSSFSPDYRVRAHELPGYISTFASLIFAEFQHQHDVWDITDMKYEDAVIRLGHLLGYFQGRQRPAQELSPRVVNNGRDYDWYLNQYDTGAYAAVNCMPTITAMALKWLDPQDGRSPEYLRGLYPEMQGGWWLETIEDALNQCGVAYQRREISLENLLQDLDAGNIILVQMSEADVEQQGHCLLLYGYRRFGDSLEFFAYDPERWVYAAYEDTASGNALMVEGEYAMLIIERFAYAYLALGEDGQEP